jgi:nicotinamide mononucleotide transporter
MPTMLELTAVVFSMLSVVLTIKKNIWLWPIGIVGVLAFLGVFWNAHLYSDTALQVVFLVQSIYGWYFWCRPKKYQTMVPVSTLDDAERTIFAAACFGATLGAGFVLTRFTDDPAPFLDASIGVLSVAAQWLLMRKVYENWHVWIAVNLVSIYVYAFKGLYLSAGEYVIFLVLAVIGLHRWRKDLLFYGQNNEPV